MMRPVNHNGLEEARLYASKEQMESLVIDDSLSDNSNVDFRSAMTSLSDFHSYHPLSVLIVTTPADRDPLLSLPILRDIKKPNFSGHSYIEPPFYADVVFGPLEMIAGEWRMMKRDRGVDDVVEAAIAGIRYAFVVCADRGCGRR